MQIKIDTSHGTFLMLSKIGLPFYDSASSVQIRTWRVFTITALKPGRDTRGVVSLAFAGSGRVVPALDDVVGVVVGLEAGVLGVVVFGVVLGGAADAFVFVNPELPIVTPALLLVLSSCCAKARKSASSASSK
jgi:hypothetical protein